MWKGNGQASSRYPSSPHCLSGVTYSVQSHSPLDRSPQKLFPVLALAHSCVDRDTQMGLVTVLP